MVGRERPRCSNCSKLYKFDWDLDQFFPNCTCKEDYCAGVSTVSSQEDATKASN